MKQVTVVDYGIGNLFSVCRALEAAGAKTVLTDSPRTIATADRLVLPGVGAFASGMSELNKRGLVEPLRKYAKNGNPLLGICLGMQLLFDCGQEFGNHEGLGILPGSVIPLPGADKAGMMLKIPHIGWNKLFRPDDITDWNQTILGSTPENSFVYFVHSYACMPASNKHIIASTHFGDHKIAATVQKDNVVGCQFHPERSGKTGLGILSCFLDL